MKAVLATLWSALREIFDEAAYEHYLAREGKQSNCDSYRRFIEQKQARQSPRCC